MKKTFILFIALITFYAGESSAQKQSISYFGNLLRINMSAKSVTLSDTLGKWYDIYKVESSGKYETDESYYYDHLTLPSGSYLLKEESGDEGPIWYSPYGFNILENEDKKNERSFSTTGAGLDILPPYLILQTEIIPSATGSWLINGNLGNAFLFNNDSLTITREKYYLYASDGMERKLIYIMGKAGERYVGAFVNYSQQNENYDYRLIDLSNSPYIDTAKSPIIHFYGGPEPDRPYMAYGKIRNVTGDLYMVHYVHLGKHLFRFSDTSFNYVKPQLDAAGKQINVGHSLNRWDFRNNKYYNFSGSQLQSYDLNLSDTTFINGRILLQADYQGDSIAVDRDFKYAALITKDTLKIYDIAKECFINALSIAGVKRPVKPVIDSPYVYLHQAVRIITGVENGNSAAVKSYELSAYPNPFNPVTTIEFSIPSAGQVEIKIYDALGKEVKTLVNEERKAGNYKVQFNAASLPSGVYLCRLSAGTYTSTKKVILLK